MHAGSDRMSRRGRWMRRLGAQARAGLGAFALLLAAAPAAAQSELSRDDAPADRGLGAAPFFSAPADVRPPPPRPAQPRLRDLGPLPETPPTPGMAPETRPERPGIHGPMPGRGRPVLRAQADGDLAREPRADADWARPRAGEQPFDAHSWRAWAGGKTVIYFDSDDRLDGYERFGRQSDRSDWRFVDGPCEAGRWSERDGVFCFDYPGGRFCYLHFRRGGDVFVRDVTDGEEFRAVLSDAPIQCGPSPTSRAPETAQPRNTVS